MKHRSIPLLALLLTLLSVLGCGGNQEPKVPVQGKVFLGDKALTQGIVTLVPDESKGNGTKFSPHGPIAEDGTYRLEAPLGWYKAIITPATASLPPEKRIKLKSQYSSPASTPLAIQVAENATEGSYYLRLTP